MPATRSTALRRASVVLALVLLTGCTSEAAPSPTAPETTAATPAASASSSATPTAATTSEPTIEKITTPPPVPLDLKTPGRVGSKAAVEYFVALYGYTLNTGDTSLLRAASTETCEFCETYAAGTESFHASGSTAVGGEVTIAFAKLHEEKSSKNRHLWVVDLSVSAVRTTSSDGQVTSDDASAETTALLAVWTGTEWRIGKHYAVNEVDD